MWSSSEIVLFAPSELRIHMVIPSLAKYIHLRVDLVNEPANLGQPHTSPIARGGDHLDGLGAKGELCAWMS